MRKLVLLALVGLGAQLVDGSLGMAYGVTSTTLLLAIGTNPAAASATVHLAEIGTTLASGASHWKFGNVDWKVVPRIGIPGAIGAFAGATFLSSLDTSVAAPVMSLILLALGLYVLVRFTVKGLRRDRLGQPLRRRFLAPLGLVAGFVDATGGGGWGPVGTPAILASGRLEPRKVIGSIDTSEFLVSVAASTRLPARPRAPPASTPAGCSPCSPAGSSRPRSPPGSCGTSRRGCSARPSAASSCSRTPAPCCAATGSTPPTPRATLVYALLAAGVGRCGRLVGAGLPGRARPRARARRHRGRAGARPPARTGAAEPA